MVFSDGAIEILTKLLGFLNPLPIKSRSPRQPVQVMVNYQGKNRASRLSPVIIALLSAEPVRYRCPGSVHSGTLLPVNIDTNSKNGKLPNGNVY